MNPGGPPRIMSRSC